MWLNRRNALLILSINLYTFAIAQNVTAYINSSAYDQGAYGIQPVQSFVSAPNLHPPAVNIRLNNVQPSDPPEYWLLAVRGSNVTQNAPVILDTDGNLIWQAGEFPSMDLLVQQYNNEPVLSYFVGSFYAQGLGKGSWNIVNSSYHIIKNVQTVGYGTNTTDFHDMVITSNNTFLLETWNVTQADLSSVGGSSQGYTWDCVVQEIDDQDNVLFEWHSLPEVGINETYFVPESGAGSSADNAFDYCHVNSVEKDDDGSYLVSMRGTSTIYKINADGSIAWRLSGKQSSFAMGPDTTFWYQHDARWLNDSSVNPRYLSLFDNAGADQSASEPIARGLVLSLDVNAMTASFVVQYNSTNNNISGSQGNAQQLDNGNFAIGWGAKPYYSEFLEDGTLIYDVHFAGSDVENLVASYRAFKQPWSGQPDTVPAIAIANNTVYGSWNGATTYTSWAILSGNTTANLSSSGIIPRYGFESNVTLPNNAQVVALAALDANNTCLSVSNPVYISNASRSDVVISCTSISISL